MTSQALERARAWMRENQLRPDASIEKMRAWMGPSPAIPDTTIAPVQVPGPGYLL